MPGNWRIDAMNKPTDNIVPLPSMEAIEAEAAAWLVLLDRGEVSPASLVEFKRWLNASERHRTAFASFSALWDDLAILDELNDIAASNEALPLHRVTRRPWLAGLAASVALLVAVGSGMFYLHGRGAQDSVRLYATATGEQRTVELVDGSRVELNTGTRIEVAFSGQLRRVRLIEGEAFFEVAHDQRRPFAVAAGDSLVEAVGTAFNVRLRDENAVEVTVEEGRVAVATAVGTAKRVEQAGVSPRAMLSAGQSTVFTERVEAIVQMPAAELDRKLAWRSGLLVYAGTPLSEVVADISRYTDMTIEIPDQALARKPVGGYFRVGQIEALLEALELNFAISVERVGPNHVRLHQAS